MKKQWSGRQVEGILQIWRVKRNLPMKNQRKKALFDLNLSNIWAKGRVPHEKAKEDNVSELIFFKYTEKSELVP